MAYIINALKKSEFMHVPHGYQLNLTTMYSHVHVHWFILHLVTISFISSYSLWLACNLHVYLPESVNWGFVIVINPVLGKSIHIHNNYISLKLLYEYLLTVYSICETSINYNIIRVQPFNFHPRCITVKCRHCAFRKSTNEFRPIYIHCQTCAL